GPDHRGRSRVCGGSAAEPGVAGAHAGGHHDRPVHRRPPPAPDRPGGPHHGGCRMRAPNLMQSLLTTARMLLSIVAIAFVVFFLIRAIPGDITDLYVASGDLTASQQERMRSEL